MDGCTSVHVPLRRPWVWVLRKGRTGWVGPARLRGFVFYPGGSAVWPQCWLCALCAVSAAAGVGGGGGGGTLSVGVSISSPSLIPSIS